MSPSAIRPTFRVLEDSLPDDMTLPAFMVSTSRGFLPRQEPIVELPVEFGPLESILQAMPITNSKSQPGLLALGELGSVVDTTFPNLKDEIEKYKDNQPLMNALYRDYSFLASAYLLEPCHHKWMETGGKEYGLGRQVLPRNIAEPISRVAELTGFYPFMEYAGSYALYNYKLSDPSKGLEYDNMSLIRAFEHGLDSKSSEAGFVLVHVDMVKDSGGLISGTTKVLNALHEQGNQSDAEKRVNVNQGFKEVVESLKKINLVMEKMWTKSKPGGYTSFRTFIFGITSQSMFPDGVIYEGISDKPLSFRGESGANDSMIPLCDNLCQIPMPETPLTTILQDFRKYRPGNHREFLEWVVERAKGPEGGLGVREYALQDKTSASWYLLVLEQIREFRYRHWNFTRDYILRRTKHPRATGGSPIVQWLPNQLFAVLELQQKVLDIIPTLKTSGKGEDLSQEVEDVRSIVEKTRTTLDREVKRFMNEEERGKDMNTKE